MQIAPSARSAPLLAGTFLAALNYTGGAVIAPLVVATLAMLATLAIAIAEVKAESVTLPVTISSSALAVLFVVLVATTASSVLPGTSATVACGIAMLPLAYLMAVTALRDDLMWRSTLDLIEWIAALVMLLGVVDFLLVRTRPFSVFQDVNALGAFCNLFALPAIVALHRQSAHNGLRRALGSATAFKLVVALACLAATASRGAHLSFVLSLMILTALLLRRNRQHWRIPAASGAAFIALTLIVIPLQNHASSLARLSDLSHDQSAADRIEMLKSTWHMVQDGPWYGSGPGTYKIRYLTYRSPAEHSTTGDLAHNDYLQFLAEGGPLLLGALLMLAFTCVLAVIRLWKVARVDDEDHFHERAGLAVALLGLFGHATLNFIFYILPLAMLAGLYLGRLDVMTPAVRHLNPFRYITRRAQV